MYVFFFGGGTPLKCGAKKKHGFPVFPGGRFFSPRNGPRFEVFWDDQRMVRLELVISTFESHMFYPTL